MYIYIYIHTHTYTYTYTYTYTHIHTHMIHLVHVFSCAYVYGARSFDRHGESESAPRSPGKIDRGEAPGDKQTNPCQGEAPCSISWPHTSTLVKSQHKYVSHDVGCFARDILLLSHDILSYQTHQRAVELCDNQG